ncbi:MAG: sulfur carrier protein ThiS [Thiotrichaceae bacterium]|nr:sulfur carrier protein ThiS [Thiotrichaceae bacterium]PCI12939.1 MAG: thiamine biosynthesis protein ThiS [Thiotrichales bacterium]
MKIQLNGEPREITDGTTLSTLLEQLEMAQQRIAVEINLSIIPRSQYVETVLQADDKIELVRAIGGG